MDENKRPENEILDLFQVEIEEVLGWQDDTPETTTPRGKLEGPFQLPQTEKAPDGQSSPFWQQLRSFFRNGKWEGKQNLPLAGLTPIVLAPFREQGQMRSDYPFWLGDVDTWEKVGASRAMPLYRLLAESVSAFAPEAQSARILKDNLTRLEFLVREKIRFADTAYLAYPVLIESLDALRDQLNIQGSEGQAFQEDLQKLRNQLPQKGWLIPFGPKAPLHLLASLLETFRHNHLKTLRTEIIRLRARLKELIRLEEAKQPGAQSAEKLQHDLGFADDLLNFDALSSVLPSGGGEMDQGRLERSRRLLDHLNRADSLLLDTKAWVVGDAQLGALLDVDWKEDFPHAQVQTEQENLCQAAANVFDFQMANLASVLVAVRQARLEVEGTYVPEKHDPAFADFVWQAFSKEELAACPPVILLVQERRLVRQELEAFTRLLASGRPVKILVLRELPDLHDPLASIDLAPLSIAHRHGFVFQGGVVDPEGFWAGCRRGLEVSAPTLWEVLPTAGNATEDYLTAIAVVESRTMPGLTYDENQGPRWGSRFDIQNNPSPEADWPVYLLEYQEGEQVREIKAPFTFADFALSQQIYQDFFLPVPPAFWSPDLLPLSDYLALSPEDQVAKVPFVWAVDADWQLQKVAVAWALVEVCRDRLDYWHFLQENAGIRNYHVEQATLEWQETWDKKWAQEQEALTQKHLEELERVREETARLAMDQLAGFLLDLDPEFSLASSPVQPTSEKLPLESSLEEKSETAEIPETPAPAEEPAPKPEAPAPLPLGEAWIDTPLCTTCGECTELNGNIFKYNAEKQAYIADPKGGPFADIVVAAESCPVRIIHPGAPQHPDEPHLDEWIKRAAPFQ